jgi:dihydroflavonol-4-reductase
MKCFVTGASGFIGANLVHELASRGHEVVALARPGADLRALNGARCDVIRGDVSDLFFLASEMRGCDWCFHVAASYHLWLRDYQPMYATNVEGTRNVLEAAASSGCSRIVHTSTVGCIGLTTPVNGHRALGDEQTPIRPGQVACHYKKSKWEAEQLALDYARRGLPVMIVNPSAAFGPRDFKPTPTGRVIVDFLNRKLPGYLDTGLNCVHVRDVAIGHILAAEMGRPGERYILGNAQGNLTLAEAFDLLEKVSGVPSPRRCVPYPVALGAAYVSEFISGFTGHSPTASVAGVRMARNKMFFDPAKAVRELGLPQTPPDQTLRDAVDWFRQNGYAP